MDPERVGVTLRLMSPNDRLSECFLWSPVRWALLVSRFYFPRDYFSHQAIFDILRLWTDRSLTPPPKGRGF